MGAVIASECPGPPFRATPDVLESGPLNGGNTGERGWYREIQLAFRIPSLEAGDGIFRWGENVQGCRSKRPTIENRHEMLGTATSKGAGL